ncbi:putative F-box/LRR-repeat protein At5g54820 isoform X2 [Triticum dicoccoides]|uniref:putative F-box/LRR-repeat protein At5g54820 isoform X2 n=1 Tax=Triticum dicoccoides TaxID=85692 RepID=UPI001890F4AD|nr:putative F-box/LRR-repeat protein At5g54820 isoform X2 [Triticum dicoccoides]
MAGAGEDEAAPPPPSPLDRQQPMEEAAAAKRSRSENHHGVADGPSFRMEDLPAEVQPVIISLLPLKEAVRMSIVSRSWTTLWRFHCDLCFNEPVDVDSNTDDNSADQVNGTGTNDQSTNQYNTKITRAKFIETVNSVIQRHSGIGINKFSIICRLHKEDYHHLDRWIRFAASSKAKIIDFDLKISDYPVEEAPHFPLEALEDQGSSFVQSLSLASVSIKPHSGLCRFTILRRLVLSSVQIFGDFPGLLAKCSRLEDLEIKWCSGVDDLIVPHKLDKLQHLLIAGTDIQMVEIHAADLAHFEYDGRLIPIVLHGCSKLEKTTIAFEASNVLPHAFNVIPSISPVKILIVRAFISKYGQSLELPLRPQGMFMHLRHMTCQIIVLARDVNDYNGVLQLAHWLDTAPRLETLDLNMSYLRSGAFVSAEVAGVEAPCMRRHDHLKTVFMSGFQCYKSQIELACCILGNASVLEQLTIEPILTEAIWGDDDYGRVCEWAQRTSKRFGKVITVLDAPLHSE